MQQRVGEVVEENVDVRKSARKTVVVVVGGEGWRWGGGASQNLFLACFGCLLSDCPMLQDEREEWEKKAGQRGGGEEEGSGG